MTPKPTFAFDGLTSTGIDMVPVNSVVLIEDDGNGKPKQFMILDNTGLTPTTTITQFLGLTSLWKPIGGAIEADATGLAGYELSTDGSSDIAVEWSPIRTNPNVLSADYTLATGASGSVVSGFTIADGVTLTIPDGSVLSVV